MNRKQRRAAHGQNPPAGGTGDAVRQLLGQATQFERQGRLDDAARTYKKLLALKPDHAEALNNLGCVLQAQDKLAEASARFAGALALTPQLYDQFAGVIATLAAVLPALAEAMQRANAAWPRRLAADELFAAEGRTAAERDPLLLDLLRATPVRDLALERVLTSLRAALLADAVADKPVGATGLAFAAALAQQCFINEYVFATTPAEDAQRAQLSARAETPLQIAVLAMYAPLSTLANAQALLARNFPPALAEVITQQMREPSEEHALQESMPRLTAIDDDVSQRVRAQYEENPYPRWVHVAGLIEPTPIDLHLRALFPTAAFTPLNKTEALEVLVAGCGTGYQAIGIAQNFQGARVLAVDLSRASLAYAKRKTPAVLREAIDYAQADILKLGGIGRSFDLVDATGVLHHMAEPLTAWRLLLDLTRPGGLMHLGFYSELARAPIVAARAFIAERGYGATPTEIRRFRQDLLASPHARVAGSTDFFSTSECRDLLFHVQEKRLTIPELKSFIAEHGLKFIGFEFEPAAQRQYRAQFAQAGWSTSDLDRWQEIETRHPDTFSRMYRLWVQKP
jgi:SAM-dependent methyltransferase